MRKIALLSMALLLVPLLSAISFVYFSSEASAAVDVSVFNDVFERKIGQPRHEHNVFPGVAGPATVKVYNGNGGGWLDRATVANVIINGKVIFRASDFNKKVKFLEKQVNLKEGENFIDVNLLGMPGVKLRIEIVQDIEADAAGLIGIEGGTIEIADENSPIFGSRLVVFGGSCENTVFGINQIDLPAALPENVIISSKVVDFWPSGFLFEKPAILTIPYFDYDNDGLIDGTNISEENIGVYYYDELEKIWKGELVLDIDLENNLVHVLTSHFSPRIVSVGDTHGDTPYSATSMYVNTSLQGGFEKRSDIDYFKFSIDRPGKIDISLVAGTQVNCYLLRYDGSVIRQQSGSEIDITYYVNPSPTTDQIFFIAVSRVNAEIAPGVYKLSLDFSFETDKAIIVPLNYSPINLKEVVPQILGRRVISKVANELLKRYVHKAFGNSLFILASALAIIDDLIDPIHVVAMFPNNEYPESADYAPSYVVLDFIGAKANENIQDFGNLYYSLEGNVLFGIGPILDNYNLLSQDEMRSLNTNTSYVIIPKVPLKRTRLFEKATINASTRVGRGKFENHIQISFSLRNYDIFQDDFEDENADGWTVYYPDGPWSVIAEPGNSANFVYWANGGPSTTGDGRSLTSINSLTNGYFVQADVKIVQQNSGSWHGIIGNGSNPENFYSFAICSGYPSLNIPPMWGLFRYAGARSNENIIFQTDSTISANKWYEMKMEFEDNTISCYIREKGQTAWRTLANRVIDDTGFGAVNGNIVGLYTHGGGTYFDNVIVSELP